jgi:DNA-binding response OmpR family regulator
MPLMNVLMLESDPDNLARMEDALRNEGYSLSRARDTGEASRLLEAQTIHIVLLSISASVPEALKTARSLRAAKRDTPLQILAIAGGQAGQEIRQSVEAGVDDFIRAPFDPAELQARTRAAQMRWETQATLVKEREFYRIAVAEEERLSSLVLDQNRHLKDAYEKIRHLNEELEKANKEL